MKLVILLSALLSFALALLLLRVFIPILKRVKLGQKILDIGPRWHKSKEGTPIMGGLFFGAAALVGCSISLIVLQIKGHIADLLPIVVSLAFIMLNFLSGFIDDYIKLFKKQNKGLSASGKLLMQLLFTVAYIFALNGMCGYTTEFFIPFYGNVEFGIFYYPIAVLGTMYTVNCVNLTDGVDGLAGSVTAVVMAFFTVIGSAFGATDVLTVSLPMLGALIGFLFYNVHPAKIFMGDTGSLMLGGTVVACALHIVECVANHQALGFVPAIIGNQLTQNFRLETTLFRLTIYTIKEMSNLVVCKGLDGVWLILA